MKHVIWILLLVTSHSFAQIIDELPKDDNGNLNFHEVVQVDSASKEQLYLRAKVFFANAFNSAKDVIQMDDREAGIIIGKGWDNIFIKIALHQVPLKMWYSVKIQSKDGRYKCEVYDISYQGETSVRGYPADVFSNKNYFKANGQPRDVNEKYKLETIRKANEVLDAVQSAMRASSLGTKKDDW
jgi:hypothetical protein